MKFALCLPIVFVIGKYQTFFGTGSGGRGVVLRVDFFRVNFLWGGNFRGFNFLGEMLHGGAVIITKRNSF
jgi:hypothetical protein